MCEKGFFKYLFVHQPPLTAQLITKDRPSLRTRPRLPPPSTNHTAGSRSEYTQSSAWA